MLWVDNLFQSTNGSAGAVHLYTAVIINSPIPQLNMSLTDNLPSHRQPGSLAVASSGQRMSDMEVDKQTLKQQIEATAGQDANALPMFRKTMSRTKYKTKQLLGRGECSTTWLVESGSGKIHVLKKVDMSRREEAMKEVNILASCSHRNIVRFGGAFVVQKEKCLLIITEFADSGNLEDYIERRRRNYKNFLTESTVRKYFFQISLGLQYLHKKNIALDLKSKHIYLTKQHLLGIAVLRSAAALLVPAPAPRCWAGRCRVTATLDRGGGNSMEVKLAALWKADIYSAEFIRLPTQEEETATHETRCVSLDEY